MDWTCDLKCPSSLCLNTMACSHVAAVSGIIVVDMKESHAPVPLPAKNIQFTIGIEHSISPKDDFVKMSKK